MGKFTRVFCPCFLTKCVYNHKSKMEIYYMTDFKITKLEFVKKKNFIVVTQDKTPITFKLINCHVPFGIEKYNGKDILNLELEKENNELYNIYSKLTAIEDIIKKQEIDADLQVTQAVRGMGFVPSVKTSLKGYILRTHIHDPDIYILKKNGDKMLIDGLNLPNTYVNASVVLNGIWLNDSNYGLLWSVTDVQVVKFA